MRKAFALFMILTLACTGGFVAAFANVNADRDTVVISEEILFGDKAHAEGLTIRSDAQLYNHLLWETSYTIGESPVTTTSFRYSTKEQRRSAPQVPDGLVVFSTRDWDNSGNPGLQQMLQEMETEAEATPGVEVVRNFRLGDYCQFYPMDFMLSLPGHHFSSSALSPDWETSPESLSEVQQNQLALHRKLNDYLKIPVLPEERWELSMAVYPGGQSRSYSTGNVGADRYNGEMNSVVSRDTCYFILHNRSIRGTKMDFSHVPGGFGIHALTFSSDDKGQTLIDPDSLSMVYPLEEDSQILWFSLTPDQDRLLLLTLEANGDCVLRVIRCDGMETLQTLVLYRTTHKRFPLVTEVRDNYIFASAGDHSIMLLEERADGTYALKLDIPVSEEEYITDIFHLSHWDGERLVLATPTRYYDWDGRNNCGYAVAVYGPSGPLFGARYTSSLDAAVLKGMAYQDMCALWDHEGLTISWTK